MRLTLTSSLGRLIFGFAIAALFSTRVANAITIATGGAAVAGNQAIHVENSSAAIGYVQVTNKFRVTSIGGFFGRANLPMTATPGTYFGALIDSRTYLAPPVPTSLTGPDVLGTTLIKVLDSLSGDRSGDFNDPIVVNPGIYGIAIGTGAFGADAISSSFAILGINFEPDATPNGERIFGHVNFNTGTFGLNSSSNGTLRVFIQGEVVPEPSSVIAAIFFTSVVILQARSRG